jgi:hypothetical protein
MHQKIPPATQPRFTALLAFLVSLVSYAFVAIQFPAGVPGNMCPFTFFRARAPSSHFSMLEVGKFGSREPATSIPLV